MKEGENKKNIMTRMRPGPDFQYLARRVKEMNRQDIPLDSDLKRDPGEIPGFYAGEHKE